MIALGEILSLELRPGDRLLLKGDLGAGKTTLVKGIARGLGFGGVVTSPTFTIMQVYLGRLPIYHLDFYRLDDRDLDGDEWEESYYGDGVTLIEWPRENVAPGDIIIEIEVMDLDYDSPRLVRLSVPADRERILEVLKKHADLEY
ncbi:MAG: tRNA (adenosine(37)-N6)-threonylcarbamoyltransferase complex ATPase subunit type 1 TsaE [Syntrophomonadaceae bacterium]|nr:tRNA (adenosine(37)-N6)-threonylcarbamoyltransferase complex ATPase subunit type 1 TsaE [Syntrophomonadaceae bacterium]